MALNGIIYGSTNNKYITCYISWSAVQNKIENYSDVTANLYYSRTNSGYSTHGTWNGAIGIDGNVVSASRSISITYNSNTFAIGNTVRVYHNNEGKKTLYINASGGISGTSLSATYCGGTVTLDDIPRVSTLSCTNANVGENPTIYIGKADANYTDTITYSFGTLTGTIATDSLASQITSWTIPESFYDEMTTVSQKSCTLTTTTKNGDVVLGTNTYTFTVSVNPEICSPLLNPTVIDTNTVTKSLTGNENTLVKYYSTATATINAEARNGATIVSQTINSLETTGNAVFTNVQTNKFVFSVKDSRGLITSQTITKNMVDYLNLTSSIEVTIPTTDGKVTLKTNGLYFNGSFGAIDNSLKASYRISESGTWGNWITFTPTLKDNSYSAIINITGLDYRLPYQFEVKLEDKLSNSSSVSQVVRAIPLFEWDDNSFDFHIEPTYNGNPIGLSIDKIYPVGSIYMSVTDVSPSSLFGGTWERIKDTFILAAGDTYAAGSTGGEAEHTLTTAEMPYHSHTILLNSASSVSYDTWDYSYGASKANRNYYSQAPAEPVIGGAGGSGAHNNMPPYLAVYIWKRTA